MLNATLALQGQASAVGTLAVSAAKIGLLSSLATPAAATPGRGLMILKTPHPALPSPALPSPAPFLSPLLPPTPLFSC
ncbi:unnamed protein product [Closterium sp. NIES-53]